MVPDTTHPSYSSLYSSIETFYPDLYFKSPTLLGTFLILHPLSSPPLASNTYQFKIYLKTSGG